MLSYYATHPQSFYRTGIANPDYPGIARFLRQQQVPDLLVDEIGVGDDFPAPESLESARFAIDDDANVGLVVDALLRRRRERQLQCTEDDVLADILLARQNVHQQQNFAAHILATP